MTIQNPHDRFFRESFGRPEIARDYMEQYLPADMLPALDLTALELQDGSFIDEEMQSHQSDLLYQVRLINGRSAYVYFLFEHKSSPEPLVPLQLLRYIVRFWERQIKNGEPLAPIVPLVIYHGERAWSVSTEFVDMLDAPPVLRPYLPNFRYHLSDFSHISDEEIRGEIWLRVSLAVLRAVFNPNLRSELADLMALLFQLRSQETGLDYIRTVLYYLTKATEKVSRADLRAALLQQGKQGESEMATIAQEFIREGYKEGIKEGIEKGVAQGVEKGRLEEKRHIARQLLRVLDMSKVSEITGLPVEELRRLS